MTDSGAFEYYYNWLLGAIAAGAHSDKVKNRLVRDFDVYKENLGDLLHYAVSANNAAVTQHVLDLGCYVDTLNEDHKTPMQVAIEQNDSDVVKVLLKANADIFVVGTHGKTIVQMVFESETMMYDIIDLFLEHTRFKFPDNEVLVKKLVEWNCPMFLAAYYVDISLLAELLRNGVNIDSRGPSHDYWTALHRAAQLDNVYLAAWLICNGADVNAVSINGFSPLHIAAGLGSVNVLRLLLEHGANPNVIELKTDCTPLNTVFAKSNNEDNEMANFDQCIELLLRYNAVPRNSNIDRRTLFDHALAKNNRHQIDRLIAHLAMVDARYGNNLVDSVMFYRVDEHLMLQSELDDNYKMCRRMLEFIVYRKLSLLDLFTMSEEKIKVCVRDVNFIPNVQSIDKQIRDRFPYYFERLIKCIDQAVVNVQLEDSAVVSLSNLFGSNYNKTYIFARKVADYLNVNELMQLKQASESL